MNWHIGQRIVAIRACRTGHFKQGDEFNILQLRASSCKCNDVEIDVGFTCLPSLVKCTACNSTSFTSTTTYWFSDRYFSPLDELEEAITREWEASKEDELVTVER